MSGHGLTSESPEIFRGLSEAKSTIIESSCENCGKIFQPQDSIVQRKDGAIVQCQHWNGFQGEGNA